MIRITLGFIILLWLGISCEADISISQKEHDHQTKPVPFAYGMKNFELTCCEGEQVRFDGEHVKSEYCSEPIPRDIGIPAGVKYPKPEAL